MIKKGLLLVNLLFSLCVMAQENVKVAPKDAYWDSDKQAWVRDRRSYKKENQEPLTRKTSFHINKTLDAGFSFSRFYRSMSGDEYVKNMPLALYGVDLNVFGGYLSWNIGVKKTGRNIYGYKERVTVNMLKIGPSLFYGVPSSGVNIVPYIGYAWCNVDDESGNSIGAMTRYGDHSRTFLFGCRLAYQYKMGKYGVHVSNKEAGVSLSLALSDNN